MGKRWNVPTWFPFSGNINANFGSWKVKVCVASKHILEPLNSEYIPEGISIEIFCPFFLFRNAISCKESPAKGRLSPDPKSESTMTASSLSIAGKSANEEISIDSFSKLFLFSRNRWL